MDEDLRTLEREASRGDVGALQRLAAALMRAGRWPEAHAATVAHWALRESVWREELASLRPHVRVEALAVEQLGWAADAEVVAWCSSHQGLRVARLDTGEVVFRDRGARGLHVRVSGPWAFVVDQRARLLRVHRDGQHEAVPWTRRAAERLFAADPAGERVVVSDAVLAWPTLEVARLLPSTIHEVSWADGLIVSSGSHVRSLLDPALERDGGHRCVPLGHGEVGVVWHGIALVRARDGRRLELARGERSAPSPSLNREGTRVRVALAADALLAWTVDLQAGRIVSGPADVVDVSGPDTPGLWHPDADVFAGVDPGPYVPRYVLRDLAGEPVLELPPRAVPLAWVDRGHALLVRRPGTREEHLEVWRAGG